MSIDRWVPRGPARAAMAALSLACVLAPASSCAYPEPDIVGLPCPCPEGYECVEGTCRLPRVTFEACPATALGCGDFEDGLGEWEVLTTSDATSEVVTSPVRVGSHALRLGTTPTSSFVVASRAIPAVDHGTIYGRVLLWIEAATVIDDLVIAAQIDDGGVDGTEKVSIDLLPEGAVQVAVTTADPVIAVRSSSARLRRDDWLCFTFRIDVDDADGVVQLELDETPIALVSGARTRPVKGDFDRLALLVASASAGIRGLVFDGVALDRAPLSCP